MDRKKVKVGVVGAGAISDIYLKNLTTLWSKIEVQSVCARRLQRAEIKADKYGLRACTLEEMLEDPGIRLVVVLTPVDTHYEIIKRALQAGKHVYTEKTIAGTTEEARELCALADEKKLYLGAAPDTFLGTCFQTARKAIDEGLIGEVHSFSVAISRNNDFATAHLPFLRLPGAGCLRDYLVYYVTVLVSLLGPAKKTGAFVKVPYPTRYNSLPGTDGYGEIIQTPNESVVAAILELESGIVGTLHEDNETIMEDRADFAIYGTKGVLLLGNPNHFGGEVRLLRADPGQQMESCVLEPVAGYSSNARGLGAAEMVDALLSGRRNRASKELSSHVLEILEAMERSGEEGRMIQISSTCERPPLFTCIEESGNPHEEEYNASD